MEGIRRKSDLSDVFCGNVWRCVTTFMDLPNEKLIEMLGFEIFNRFFKRWDGTNWELSEGARNFWSGGLASNLYWGAALRERAVTLCPNMSLMRSSSGQCQEPNNGSVDSFDMLLLQADTRDSRQDAEFAVQRSRRCVSTDLDGDVRCIKEHIMEL